MTADNAKIIDRGEELQKIKDKYGRRYCIEPEATEEAAKLWGVEANEHGVPLNVETECVLNFQRAFASVHLASTSKGQWLVGISASTAVSGLGYYPVARRRKTKEPNIMDRIENLPFFQETLGGIEEFSRLSDFLGRTGVEIPKIEQISMELNTLKKKFEPLAKLPDEFNSLFSSQGWIAHESMKADLMQKAVQLAKRGKIRDAEELLADYYTSAELEWLRHTFRGVGAFRIREDQISGAYNDTVEGRYSSAVRHLLAIIDGVLNDIAKTGFFAENTVISAWNSIAAHSTGLAALKEIFNMSRKNTNTEEIFIPYRHGIVHGRDLNFGNKLVTGKCWAALCAISDWADKLENGSEEPSFRMNAQSVDLKDLLLKFKRAEETKRAARGWTRRPAVIGLDIPESGASTDYAEHSPEREVAKFAENWGKGNYGAIAQQIWWGSYKQEPFVLNREAGKVRDLLKGNNLIDFELRNVDETAPAATDIFVKFRVDRAGQEREITIKMRFLYVDKNGETLVAGDPEGEWKFIDGFVLGELEKLNYLYY